MPGHNHKSGCSCGWCFKPHYFTGENEPLALGNVQTNEPAALNLRKLTYRSFVNPNALCPVCGITVFFYQSEHGGRVFFDALGPPWPKHPCTDNRKSVKALSSQRKLREATPLLWQAEGWQPFVCHEASKCKDGTVRLVGYLHSATTNKLLCLCATKVPAGILSIPMQIRQKLGAPKEYECSCPLGEFQAKLQ